MWVFTEFGFFSIVAHRDKPGFLLVRSRVRADLVRFSKILPGTRRICSTPEADYAYRLVAPADDVASALEQTARSIDYDNFKARVVERQGVERENVYMGVWSHLRTWLRGRNAA